MATYSGSHVAGARVIRVKARPIRHALGIMPHTTGEF